MRGARDSGRGPRAGPSGAGRPAPEPAAGALAATVLGLALLAAGCGDGISAYGEMSPGAQEIGIETLLEAPELHLGKEVRVSGRVAQVCQVMGCWFEILDKDRRLMIDLQMGRRFSVPEGSAGRWAVVVGTFVRQDGVLRVIGRGVELHDSRPS